jgi:hypothetical protein
MKHFFLKYWKVTPFLVVIVYLLIQGKNGDIAKNKILRNMDIVPCKIIDFRYGGNGGSMFTYTLAYKNRVYTYKSYSRFISSNGKEMFLRKRIPVALSKNEPDYHAILITPDDFKSLGLNFPDSLKWVLEYKQP